MPTETTASPDPAKIWKELTPKMRRDLLALAGSGTFLALRQRGLVSNGGGVPLGTRTPLGELVTAHGVAIQVVK